MSDIGGDQDTERERERDWRVEALERGASCQGGIIREKPGVIYLTMRPDPISCGPCQLEIRFKLYLTRISPYIYHIIPSFIKKYRESLNIRMTGFRNEEVLL